MLLDALAQVRRQRREPAAVRLGADPDGVAGELLLGEPVRVLPAGLDQGVDQRVTVPGRDPREVSGVVAGRRHRLQQRDGAGRRIQADRVADPRVLGRVRAEHQDDPLVRVRDTAQPGMADRDPGDPRRPLGVGHVDRQAVGVELLERERHGDQPAVELGHGDLRGDIERREPVVALCPARAAARQAEALQDRDVQRGQRSDVPGLVVPAGSGARGLRPARRENGDDHRVGRTQRLEQGGLGLAERGAVDGERATPGVFDGGAQRLDIGGVAGELLGPVVEDGDRRAVRRARRTLEDPPARQLGRGREALAGEQYGVGEEGVQMGEVRGTPLREVRVGLRGNPGGHRRQLHHLRVGRLLAAQRDHRLAGPEHGVDAVFPVAAAAEDADHDHVGRGEQRREVDDPVRVRGTPRGARGAGGEQVRVRRGQQQDHRDGPGSAGRMTDPSRDPRPGFDGEAGQFLAPGCAVGWRPVTVAGPRRTRTGFLVPARMWSCGARSRQTLARGRARPSSRPLASARRHERRFV